MCGRFALTFTKLKDLYKRFGIENPLKEDFKPRYNVAPFQTMPIVTQQDKKQISLMKWGLIPHWAKDPKIGYKMINARSETLLEKPSFKIRLWTSLQRSSSTLMSLQSLH